VSRHGSTSIRTGTPDRAIAKLRESQALHALVGEAPAFLDALERVRAIARSTASVVVEGETGTGKELIARAVHYLGPKAGGPFIAVNCGSLSESLLEDELFGHEPGAYTDARGKRLGLVAQADGGTLFLDEVDALSPRAQVALLRVLQEKSVRALGSEATIQVDVRFIAATNSSLLALVRSGRFRADLYFRMCVLGVAMPPLRQRGRDVILLANHFLERHTPPGRRFELSPQASQALQAYLWPGNVRELENVVQRAATMARTAQIGVTDLGLAIYDLQPAPIDAIEVAATSVPSFREAKRQVVEAFERQFVLNALRNYAGNVTKAAAAAGKERRDFGRLLRKYAFDPRDFQPNPTG
jgi:DNA-binding NtrC family response regulator